MSEKVKMNNRNENANDSKDQVRMNTKMYWHIRLHQYIYYFYWLIMRTNRGKTTT